MIRVVGQMNKLDNHDKKFGRYETAENGIILYLRVSLDPKKRVNKKEWTVQSDSGGHPNSRV